MKRNEIDQPHYVHHRQRLKERFIHNGLTGARDYEILELLLTYAIQRKDVKPLAKRLVAAFGSLEAVFDAPADELAKINGIGRHSAILIKLVRACSDIYLRSRLTHVDVVSSPEDLLRYCRSTMAALDDEHFRIIHLNAKNHIIYEDITHHGTVDHAVVYPRRVMEQALKHKSVALILVHNHPSGSPEPSRHDRDLTQRLVRAAETLGITVHDHIIITRNGFCSFRQEGLM